MTSGRELDRFLDELGIRRQRMLQVAEASGPRPGDLMEELSELSEHLIVADEELRVQQEELEEARAALLSLSAERDLLLEDSSRAYVVTDDHGVVARSTRAAQQLVRQPPGRVAPRPIALWFEVVDRSAVRSMIGRVVATGEPQRLAGVRVRSSDSVERPVGLAVEKVTGADEGRSLLRWELTPDARGLYALPGGAELDGDRDAGPALALRLASIAVELELCRTREELFRRLVDVVVHVVPGAQHAGLVLQKPRVAPELVAATSDVARFADGVQLTQQVGPVEAAMTASRPVRSNRLVEELWSGSSLGPGDAAPGCAIALPLLVGEQRVGVLTVYADQPGALDAEAELIATALSMQGAVALRRLFVTEDLMKAVHARQLVGQAVGRLVERHRLTPEMAFSLLVQWSQHGNVKLRSVARALVETGQEPPPLPRS